ncbi:unnamed protein product [Sphagnum tenellum]
MGFKARKLREVLGGGILICMLLIQANASPPTKENSWNERMQNIVKADHRNAPANVVWVVQLSDLHISKWIPERSKALRKSLGHALQFIKPALVWITGDLTDAKNKERTATRQDEGEWIDYWDSIQKVADGSGLPIERFFDMRGNHDKYGVPLSSSLDYYSAYSVNGHLNRTNLVQSITVLGGDGRKHLFVGIDDAMQIGLRAPSNVFGHPTDQSLVDIDQQLSQWDHDNSAPVTKIVFGHFPMSFTTSTETGKHPEGIFAKHNISAYVCGHLHTKFGKHLYKHHSHEECSSVKKSMQRFVPKNCCHFGRLVFPEYKQVGEFWEWEMGDWRVSRMMRIMATDNGHTSFVDVELIPPKEKSDQEFVMPTIILPTFPLNSLTMLQGSVKILPLDRIRVLIFSNTPPIWVKARIIDAKSLALTVVEEISMRLIDYNSGIRGESGPYYYDAVWNSAEYADDSPTRYWLEIILEEKEKGITVSEPRPFSVNGHLGNFRLTWLGYLGMGFRWEKLYPFLLWGMVAFVFSMLIVPKVFSFQLEKANLCDEWVMTVLRPASDFRTMIFKLIKVPFWVVFENARNTCIWACSLAYVMCLTFLPWFSGRVLADDFPIGHMSVWGWSVKPSNVTSVNQVSGLGVPDIMEIVLPHMYTVLFPLILMVSALSAERAACRHHIGMAGKCHRQSGSKLSQWLLNEYCSVCNRLIRKGLFVGCLAITFLHWRLLSSLMRAYGSTVLVMTPIFAWTVPALIVFSLIQTSPIRPISVAAHEN